MTQQEIRELRMEVLRLAVENGTPADVVDPIRLANTYYLWVISDLEPAQTGQKPPPSRKR
jgi:hypothetical protein